jgi:ABC-2 type transport system permease protein
MAWASPIRVKPDGDRKITTLLRSSPRSWLRDSRDIMPSVDDGGRSNLRPPSADDDASGLAPITTSHALGVVAQGRFESYFAQQEIPRDATAADAGASPPQARVSGAPIEHSAESARLVLFSSNDFLDDQVLSSIVAASGTQYLGPLELFMNTLDWALQDEQLLEIRSRAHFNRTLPPMERQAQLVLEYFNYGLALLWLLVLGLISWLQLILRRRHYAKGLAL